jgi:hypothetical protein
LQAIEIVEETADVVSRFAPFYGGYMHRFHPVGILRRLGRGTRSFAFARGSLDRRIGVQGPIGAVRGCKRPVQFNLQPRQCLGIGAFLFAADQSRTNSLTFS